MDSSDYVPYSIWQYNKLGGNSTNKKAANREKTLLN
jgi:hypothetical protein